MRAFGCLCLGNVVLGIDPCLLTMYTSHAGCDKASECVGGLQCRRGMLVLLWKSLVDDADYFRNDRWAFCGCVAVIGLGDLVTWRHFVRA